MTWEKSCVLFLYRFVTKMCIRDRNMHGDKTIFIVSQRTSSIQFADNIIVLDDGQMVGFGPHDCLLYTSYYNEDDEPCGYMVYLISSDVMHIKELIYLNREAQLGLWEDVYKRQQGKRAVA